MKRAFPIAIIAVMGILSFTSSCKKKSSSNTCYCTTRGSHNQDTVQTFSTVDTPYTSVSQECSVADAFEKLDSARYGCHM